MGKAGAECGEGGRAGKVREGLTGGEGLSLGSVRRNVEACGAQ